MTTGKNLIAPVREHFVRHLVSQALGLTCAALLATHAFGQADPAQAYPSRAVRLIAPFPPGSNADQVARIVGDQLQKALGQPFIVENRPGATGSIAADYVAKAAPDGYTLFLPTNSPLVVNQSLFKKLSYDPVKDFAPIIRTGITGFVFMVRPDFPAKTLAELVALAKAQPGKLSAGSGGAGGQVSIALLKAKADIDLIDVPYKGVPQSVTDVLGGSLNMGAFDLGNAMPQIQSGKLRPLAVTLSEPTALAPGVPTAAETFPGFEVVPWHGLVAPAGTPPQIIAKLYDAAANALAKPEIKAAFANTGNVVAPLTPTEFSKFIQSEIPKWATLVEVGGLKPD